MNLSEIRSECWDQARELDAEDRLWPADQMNRYINRVYRRLAAETRCIRDNTTADVCLISSAVVDYTTYDSSTVDYLWANDSGSWLYQKNVAPYLFALHPSIRQVDEVKWVSRQWKLTKVSCEKWKTNPWWERVVGMPTEYATDLKSGCIAVNFRDETSDTLHLHVRRLPLVWLVNDSDVPEIRENYHEFFMNGVLSYMYAKKDSEVFDAEKSLNYQAAFERDIDEIKQMESQMDTFLRPNWAMNAFR